MTAPRDDFLAELGADVARWHREQWPELLNPVLPAVKVAEEAGELVGAVVKYLEGRGTWIEVLSELGDVVIAAAGAAARLEELASSRSTGTPALAPMPDLEELVLTRWDDVRRRRYGPDLELFDELRRGFTWPRPKELVELEERFLVDEDLEGPTC